MFSRANRAARSQFPPWWWMAPQHPCARGAVTRHPPRAPAGPPPADSRPETAPNPRTQRTSLPILSSPRRHPVRVGSGGGRSVWVSAASTASPTPAPARAASAASWPTATAAAASVPAATPAPTAAPAATAAPASSASFSRVGMREDVLRHRVHHPRRPPPRPPRVQLRPRLLDQLVVYHARWARRLARPAVQAQVQVFHHARRRDRCPHRRGPSST